MARKSSISDIKTDQIHSSVPAQRPVAIPVTSTVCYLFIQRHQQRTIEVRITESRTFSLVDQRSYFPISICYVQLRMFRCGKNARPMVQLPTGDGRLASQRISTCVRSKLAVNKDSNHRRCCVAPKHDRTNGHYRRCFTAAALRKILLAPYTTSPNPFEDHYVSAIRVSTQIRITFHLSAHELIIC